LGIEDFELQVQTKENGIISSFNTSIKLIELFLLSGKLKKQENRAAVQSGLFRIAYCPI